MVRSIEVRRLSVVKTVVMVELFRVPQILLVLGMVVRFLGPLGEEHVGFNWCSAIFSGCGACDWPQRLRFTTSDHVVAASCLL